MRDDVFVRTPLDLDDDTLLAVKGVAGSRRATAGRRLSGPARKVIPRELSVITAAACLLAAAAFVVGAAGTPPPGPPRSARYEDLLSFFREWRAFQRPKLIDGVPDYSARALAAQLRELETWRRRLFAAEARGLGG